MQALSKEIKLHNKFLLKSSRKKGDHLCKIARIIRIKGLSAITFYQANLRFYLTKRRINLTFYPENSFQMFSMIKKASQSPKNIHSLNFNLQKILSSATKNIRKIKIFSNLKSLIIYNDRSFLPREARGIAPIFKYLRNLTNLKFNLSLLQGYSDSRNLFYRSLRNCTKLKSLYFPIRISDITIFLEILTCFKKLEFLGLEIKTDIFKNIKTLTNELQDLTATFKKFRAIHYALDERKLCSLFLNYPTDNIESLKINQAFNSDISVYFMKELSSFLKTSNIKILDLDFSYTNQFGSQCLNILSEAFQGKQLKSLFLSLRSTKIDNNAYDNLMKNVLNEDMKELSVEMTACSNLFTNFSTLRQQIALTFNGREIIKHKFFVVSIFRYTSRLF